jgi:hypothetical protein
MSKKLSEIQAFVKAEMTKIDTDERYHYKTALVQVNAPLALIQLEMSAKMVILKKVKALLDQP